MTNLSSQASSFPCPHCGADVPAHARLCRACGADEECGWPDHDFYDDAESDFDYDEYIQREFGATSADVAAFPQRNWVRVIVLLIVLTTILTLIVA